MDAKTRRTTFRVIAKASAASGFEAAVRAGEHLVEQGHAIDEASVTTMARRIAAGEKPYEQSVPDLTGYDVFMKPPTAMGKEGGLTMGTHRPPVVMPDMKRRRASTGERIATIMTLARRPP